MQYVVIVVIGHLTSHPTSAGTERYNRENTFDHASPEGRQHFPLTVEEASADNGQQHPTRPFFRSAKNWLTKAPPPPLSYRLHKNPARSEATSYSSLYMHRIAIALFVPQPRDSKAFPRVSQPSHVSLGCADDEKPHKMQYISSF